MEQGLLIIRQRLQHKSLEGKTDAVVLHKALLAIRCC